MEELEKNFFELKNELEQEPEYKIELAKASATASKSSVKKAAKESEFEPEGQLTIDVYQTPKEIVVESAIAGIKPEDLDITVTTDSITIKGERRREAEIKDDDYLYQECYWGKFSRSIILPQEIDAENAAVGLKNGILTIRLPKLDRKKEKKLKVKID